MFAKEISDANRAPDSPRTCHLQIKYLQNEIPDHDFHLQITFRKCLDAVALLKKTKDRLESFDL